MIRASRKVLWKTSSDFCILKFGAITDDLLNCDSNNCSRIILYNFGFFLNCVRVYLILNDCAVPRLCMVHVQCHLKSHH